MKFKRMPIEIESPEQIGYETINCNLAESSVSDLAFRDLNIDLEKIKLGYGHHVGNRALREMIASQDKNVKAADVLITAGAAAGLFIATSSLLDKKDHLIVLHPNYASNIETPLAIGCAISYAKLEFENKFMINIPGIRKMIRRNTKLISITSPHNPTGMCISAREMEELITLAEEKNIFLLVDETYRDLNFGVKLPLAASISKQVISISSLSKAYGLPGICIGWMITRNKKLQELFLAAKEQIFVCNSVIDEAIACSFMKQKTKFVKRINANTENNFKTLMNWMDGEGSMEWVRPAGGAVAFPRMKFPAQMNVRKFYSVLLKRYKTMVGPGHWFDMSDSYMRIGFGWPGSKEFSEGLKNISLALADSLIADRERR